MALWSPSVLFLENRLTLSARLFSYGTLRQKAVQLANFGRGAPWVYGLATRVFDIVAADSRPRRRGDER
jgi:hypothetical protein